MIVWSSQRRAPNCPPPENTVRPRSRVPASPGDARDLRVRTAANPSRLFCHDGTGYWVLVDGVDVAPQPVDHPVDLSSLGAPLGHQTPHNSTKQPQPLTTEMLITPGDGPAKPEYLRLHLFFASRGSSVRVRSAPQRLTRGNTADLSCGRFAVRSADTPDQVPPTLMVMRPLE